MRNLTGWLVFSCAAFVVGSAWQGTARADQIFNIVIDTSSESTQYGYLDLQFDGALVTQIATAELENFSTGGALNPGDINNGTSGDVTGTLPGTLSFDNGTSFDDYIEGITFGNQISFELDLGGAAINSPNGDGGGTFLIDFLNSGQNAYLFTNDPTGSTAYGWTAAYFDINPDGSVSVTTPPGPGDGPSLVSIGAVPEPAPVGLLGIGLAALALVRSRHRAR
jgi:hypothetical protein